MEGERRRRCYRCQSTEHVVSQCLRKKVSKKKPAKKTLVQRMEPQEDFTVIGTLRANVEQMELYERVALLDRMEWTPEVCHTCGKNNPKHNNLECPVMSNALAARVPEPMGTSRPMPVTPPPPTLPTLTWSTTTVTTTSTGTNMTR